MATNIRSYGPILSRAMLAINSAIEKANSVNDPYYREGSLILLANAWELIAKALLIKHGGDGLIYEIGSKKERTITAENAVNKLKNLGYINDIQASPVQQVISLRNEASHNILPDFPDEILFHLEYYAIRYFKELLDINFKSHSKKFRKHYLSVSFDGVVTYSDKVKSLLAKTRKHNRPEDLRAAYLLERGAAFNGGQYIRQPDFNKLVLDKKVARPSFKLKMGTYARSADMIVVVPIQAPSGTQADIKLSKGSSSTVTVHIEKSATDDDYPHLTQDLSAKLGVSRYFVSGMIKELKIKDDLRYHQRVRTGKASYSQKYSDSCLQLLKKHLEVNPDYRPTNTI